MNRKQAKKYNKMTSKQIEKLIDNAIKKYTQK